MYVDYLQNSNSLIYTVILIQISIVKFFFTDNQSILHLDSFMTLNIQSAQALHILIVFNCHVLTRTGHKSATQLIPAVRGP